MNRNIIKAEDLPEKALVYLKKDGENYRVVHPIKNEDGSINWFNLLTGGSWMNIAILSVVVGVILGVLLEYSTTVRLLQDQLEQCVVINPLF